MKKREKALVTGGAGFIGSHLVDRLVKEHFDVTIFDNFSTGLKEYVNPKAKLIIGDLRNQKNIDALFKNNFDLVFHIAGQASNINSFSSPIPDIETNFIGTVNIVQKCVEKKIERFLYASSMLVYGPQNKLPIKENIFAKPTSYYGINKYAAERFVHATAQRIDLKEKFNVTSFRMFNVYGERQSLTNPYQGVFAIFIGNVLRKEPIKIFGDGKQSRDFVYIKDVVDAWIKSIDNKKTYGKIYNLGSGIDISINKLAATVLKTLNIKAKHYNIIYKPQRPGEQGKIRSDIRQIKEDLYWEPQFSLEKGLRNTIKWAQKS